MLRCITLSYATRMEAGIPYLLCTPIASPERLAYGPASAGVVGGGRRWFVACS